MTVSPLVRQAWQRIEDITADNAVRVLKAFRNAGLSSPDLAGSTGYGYDDRGRSRLDQIVADIFGTEKALVRAQWVSGTHALATAVKALLQPGDHLWIAGGPIYDTLHRLFFSKEPGGLAAHGVVVRSVPWNQGQPDWEQMSRWPGPDVIYVQRSRGYQLRPSWGRAWMRPVIGKAHSLGAVVIVDNCYGEFTGTEEPTHWGADMVVGSLLKNPGGGVAPTGAYVAGRSALVERIADELFAPGIGLEVGPTGPYQRLMAQGWFLAPQMVGEALLGGVYASDLFARAGFSVDPRPDESERNDIITAIRLGRPDFVERFVRAVQAHSPIDSHVVPEAWSMPGYEHPVIMAAGGFVAGGSLELSADAPMREPYWVYLQGGLNRWHTMVAAEAALAALQ